MDSNQSSDIPSQAPETPESEGEKDVPRFITAIGQLEQAVAAEAQAFAGTDEEKAEHLMDYMRRCRTVASAAQTFEFMLGVPTLAATPAEDSAREQLAAAVNDPDLPPEVSAIYRDLYAQELQTALPADE